MNFDKLRFLIDIDENYYDNGEKYFHSRVHFKSKLYIFFFIYIK
jgi:hypothetical protein